MRRLDAVSAGLIAATAVIYAAAHNPGAAFASVMWLGYFIAWARAKRRPTRPFGKRGAR